MKKLSPVFLGVLLFGLFSSFSIPAHKQVRETGGHDFSKDKITREPFGMQPGAFAFVEETDTIPGEFRLNYTSIGLGSNFCSMQPVLTIRGNQFRYTSEQTSWYEGMKREQAKLILAGSIRQSSIDSILSLAGMLQDTVISRTNPYIMSGGLHTISISGEKVNVRFELYNTSDPLARKVVDILNTYIPEQKGKLWLFDIPEN